jgi:hypothetical protein
MTDLERLNYYKHCNPSQTPGEAFGDHEYDDDENAADLTDDDLEEVRPPS